MTDVFHSYFKTNYRKALLKVLGPFTQNRLKDSPYICTRPICFKSVKKKHVLFCLSNGYLKEHQQNVMSIPPCNYQKTLTGMDNEYQMLSKASSGYWFRGSGHRGNTRSGRGGGAKRYDSFTGFDLWLAPRLCALPQIETRFSVLAWATTD